MEGHIFTDEVIDENYPKVIKAQLSRLGRVDRIIHHISSPGGDCYAGYEAYHILKNYGKPITSIIEGQAQSMATFMALAGDEIEILDPSVFMIHNPHMGTQGDADALQNGSAELRKIEDAMAQAYAKRTKKTVEEIKAMMKKETRFTAREAVDAGFADRIVSHKPLSTEQYSQLRAVALGKTTMEGDKTILDKIQDGLNTILTKLSPPAEGAIQADATTTPVVTPPAQAPKSLDLALKDGSMLTVMTENGDLVGKTATVNGSPAPDGTHDLGDGRQIVISGGVITEVMEPETPEQKAIREATEKLAAAEAEKQALQAQAEVVKKELEQKAAALAAVKTEVEKLKNETVGSDEPTRAVAIGIMKTKEEELKLYATRTFIADNMPHMERYYKGGKFKDGTRFVDYRTGSPNAVSILETNLSYTWDGILETELFFKPTLGSPALADIFMIDTGATDKKVYHIAPVMNKVLKPYTGCDQSVTGSAFQITSKAIQLKPFEMYEGWCKDDFTKQLQGQYNILSQQWLKTGTESFDPAGTPIDRIIVNSLKDALRRDIFRRVSFGRSGNASADWNQITGLWPALIDNSGGSNYCVYRASATNGTGAVGFGTGTLASGAALLALQSAYNNSPNLLKQEVIDSGRAQFVVTRSVWENYYDTLVANGSINSASDSLYENLQNGITTLKFKGVPVIPVTIWDDFLADSANPLFATTRHLVALTVKENHVLGIENTADLGKIDSWFEKKDNRRYYRSNMVMGFLPSIHCDLTTIVY